MSNQQPAQPMMYYYVTMPGQAQFGQGDGMQGQTVPAGYVDAQQMQGFNMGQQQAYGFVQGQDGNAMNMQQMGQAPTMMAPSGMGMGGSQVMVLMNMPQNQMMDQGVHSNWNACGGQEGNSNSGQNQGHAVMMPQQFQQFPMPQGGQQQPQQQPQQQQPQQQPQQPQQQQQQQPPQSQPQSQPQMQHKRGGSRTVAWPRFLPGVPRVSQRSHCLQSLRHFGRTTLWLNCLLCSAGHSSC